MADYNNRTGPFVAIGWLACGGLCATTAATTLDRCKQQDAGNLHSPQLVPWNKRDSDESNACLQVPNYNWPCPQMEKDILSASNCSETSDKSLAIADGDTGAENVHAG